MRLAAVNVVGAERANPEFVAQTFGLQAGDVVDNRRIGDRANAVFALSDFERVAYTLEGDSEEPVLNLHLMEKSWGPNIVRFDLGFHIGTDANTAFTIGGDFLRTWINDRGGEVHGSWRFGRTSGLEASLYQPLDAEHRWFVEPGALGQRSIEDIFIDGDAVARYRFSHAWGYLEAGRVFGNRAELRAGIRGGGQSVDREIGTPDLPEISGEGYGGLSMRYTYDTRDRDVLWQDGSLVRMTYFRGEESLGAVQQYDRLEGMAMAVVPFNRNVLYLRATGGASFGNDLPIYDTFTLGGPVSMPGPECRRTARHLVLGRAGLVPAAHCRHQLRVRPVAVRRPRVIRGRHERSDRRRPRRADLFRGVRAGGSHAARSRVAVLRGDQRQRLAADVRAGAADRRADDHGPLVVTLSPRRAARAARVTAASAAGSARSPRCPSVWRVRWLPG